MRFAIRYHSFHPMFLYKCYSCMKQFESARLFLDVSSGGACPRCRTMVTRVNLVRGPRIEHLAPVLNVINPNHGTNPDGNCIHSAVETAEALTHGLRPTTVDGSLGSVAKRAPTPGTAIPAVGRSAAVTAFLALAPPNSVFAVDADDHAYNFVKGPYGHVFVLDSNQHFYRRVSAGPDYVAYVANENLTDGLRYDYSDPVSDSGDMDIYFWGNLHANYQLYFANL